MWPPKRTPTSSRRRSKGASRQITVEYEDRATSDELQLYGISPRRGSYGGGEEAVITGKGILSPVDVFFDLNGQSFQAIVAAVVESDPPSEDGSVTVITPAFTGENSSIQQAADVRVIANAGTGSQESDTLGQAFVLLPGGGPIVFGLSPSSGSSSGGETVNVLGQGFGTVASDIIVSFTDESGVVRLAPVLAVAPDGSQIQIETPLFSTIPLEQDSAPGRQYFDPGWSDQTRGRLPGSCRQSGAGNHESLADIGSARRRHFGDDLR